MCVVEICRKEEKQTVLDEQETQETHISGSGPCTNVCKKYKHRGESWQISCKYLNGTSYYTLMMLFTIWRI